MDMGTVGRRIAVHLPELKEVVNETHARAAVLQNEGQDYLAAQAYTTLFARLNAHFTGAHAQTLGWPQVVLAVTQLSNRLSLDALERQHVRRLRIRAATLLDLSEVTTLTCLNDIQSPIRTDLAIALTRREAGDFRGCCTVHWATGRALLAAQVTRAFPGCAKAMAPIRQAHEADPPQHALDERGISFYAFTLRVALEAALAIRG
jgi:hypothetical protein